MNHPALPLIAAGATLPGLLGAVHLLYTFHGDKLHPRDPALKAAMESAFPVITRQTTVWRANLGFNASHAMGLMLFGALYAHLALWQAPLLAGSTFLLALGMAALLGWLMLAWRCFFHIPQQGIALACGLYALGWWLA